MFRFHPDGLLLSVILLASASEGVDPSDPPENELCDLARKSNTNSSMYLRCILNRRTAGASVHEDSLLTIIV